LGGQTPVLWDKYLGHKARKSKKLVPVMEGEDGMIARDSETGKRVFLKNSDKDAK
jgi:hypothetical protein